MNAHSTAKVDSPKRSAVLNEPETLMKLPLITVSNTLPLKARLKTGATCSAASDGYYAAIPLG